MCRSKVNGGRRCTGRTTTSATAPATIPSTTSAGVPDRDRTDALAAALPADRTGWDGQLLSEKDRRQYALRESGYTGWIDQDGYPVSDAQASALTEQWSRDWARGGTAGRGEHADR